MICQAALDCRRELETAWLVICLHWQSVEKGEGNTSSLCRFPSYKLFDKELEFILLALRELRQEFPFRKTTPFHRFFCRKPLWLVPASWKIVQVWYRAQEATPSHSTRFAAGREGMKDYQFTLYGGRFGCQEFHFKIFTWTIPLDNWMNVIILLVPEESCSKSQMTVSGIWKCNKDVNFWRK